MKRFMLIPALALVMAAAVPAQVFTPSTTVNNSVSEYFVQKGDNLWKLSELKLHNPEQWHWLVVQNPFLNNPGRQFTKKDGTFVVIIKEGEVLRGLREVGVTSNTIANNTTPPYHDSETRVVGKTFSEKVGDFFAHNWWWLAFLGLLGLAALWLRREVRRDPVESRPAQVPGGVNTVVDAQARFSERGARQHFTILDTTAGWISGTMGVSYADGTRRPRTLDRQRAYQATVRHQDGRTESLYMLQACGNDLKYGGIERYLPGPDFSFIPDPVVVPTPEPVAETPPAPEAAALDLTDVAPPAEVGNRPELKIELKPAETPGATAMVRVTGAPTEDMVLTVTDDTFTLRFHPASK